MSKELYEERLALYDAIINKCSRFDRKGKTMPYTSANGYMFSLLNKNAQLGYRFSRESQDKYKKEWPTTIFKSYGATMKDYVLIPENMLDNTEILVELLNESYDFVMTLKPK